MNTKLGWPDESLEHFQHRAQELQEVTQVYLDEIDLLKAAQEKERRLVEISLYTGRKVYTLRSSDRPEPKFPARARATAFIVFDFVALVGTLIWVPTHGGTQ